jgi:Na+/proline symporter
VSFNAILLVALVVYFAVVLLEGYVSFRRSSGVGDYLCAGRRVGPWICGASLSAGTFVGTVGLHYLTGVNRWATAITGTVPILLTFQQLGVVQFIVNAFASLLASGIAVPVILGRARSAGVVNRAKDADVAR